MYLHASKTTAAVLAALLVMTFQIAAGAATPGQWVTGDFHTHTNLTDGIHTEPDVVGHAFDAFGLDWMANSEHGGAFPTDPNGTNWEKLNPAPYIAGNPGKDKDGHSLMWRWQSLRDYSYPIIASLRARYPDRVLFQSLEWNVPSHEHASVGILASEPKAVSDFEYQFDANDKDNSRAWQGLVKRNATHADAVAAASFLQRNYAETSYILLNHPSRKQKYSVADIRDLNNAAPTVFFGFEGLPGHQKEGNRGGYDSDLGANTSRARTYGGTDYMVAKVGGLWDSLLGEGRHFWTFVNSDFHSAAADADFYPGEYAKTYVFVKEKSTKAILDGLRSGNSFAVHGDLIDTLDFTAQSGQASATMGQSLQVAKGSDATVVIRFNSPDRNNNGDRPVVDHVDVIAGDVTGRINPGDPNYNNETNPSARVIARLTNKDWSIDSDGCYSVVLNLANLQKDQYIRLRGTNLPVNTPNETDREGNPLSDELAKNRGLDNAAEAYADLWFYSNPIFLTVSK